MYRIVYAVAIPIGLSGCAYLTTFNKDIGSPDQGIAIDAKQRLVLFNKVENKDKQKEIRMCAEPSPDALSALGASIGASFFNAASTKQLAAALSESTANIGLRTTSIQLMRDAMYRVCEAYISGGIDGPTYGDLQAHAQTLVVGLLAIEQLTGAVQAQQVALTSSSSAVGGGTDLAKETDDLTQSKKATVEQKSKADAADKVQQEAEKAVKSKADEIAAAKADANTKAEDLKKLEGEHLELTQKAIEAKGVTNKELELTKIAQSAEAVYQANFDMARARVRGSASGDAKWSQQSRGNLTEATAAALSKSVEAIVTRVTETSIESQTQKCLNFFFRTDTNGFKGDQLNTLRELCGLAVARAQTANDLLRLENRLPSLPSVIRQSPPPPPPGPAPSPPPPPPQ